MNSDARSVDDPNRRHELWALGDTWRDLREEISRANHPIVAHTAAGSIRVLHPREGWQARFPQRTGGVIAGDGFQLELEWMGLPRAEVTGGFRRRGPSVGS